MAGGAPVVRHAAASEAATASVRSTAAARVMSVLLAIDGLAIGPRGALLSGRPPVGEERVGHAGVHRAQAGAVAVHDVEVRADPSGRAFPVVLQDDPPTVGRVAGEGTLQRRRAEVGELPQTVAV